MIELILFAVYFLSAILSWRYVNLVYSKKGRWSILTPCLLDFLISFVPAINTLFCVMGWLFFYPVDKKKLDYSKFFNVKK